MVSNLQKFSSNLQCIPDISTCVENLSLANNSKNRRNNQDISEQHNQINSSNCVNSDQYLGDWFYNKSSQFCIRLNKLVNQRLISYGLKDIIGEDYGKVWNIYIYCLLMQDQNSQERLIYKTEFVKEKRWNVDTIGRLFASVCVQVRSVEGYFKMVSYNIKVFN